MASNVSPQDLIAPKGPIPLTLFPEETQDNLEERLNGAIEEAEDEIADKMSGKTLDKAVKAWCRYRIYEAALVARLDQPATSVMADQGSETYIASQIDAWRRLRDDAKAEYDAFLASVTGSGSTKPVSQSLRNEYEW